DPVEALEIQRHMVIEQVIHVDDGGHGTPPPRGQARTQRPIRPNVSHSPMRCPRRSEAGLIGTERKTGFEPATLTLARWRFSSTGFQPVPWPAVPSTPFPVSPPDSPL